MRMNRRTLLRTAAAAPLIATPAAIARAQTDDGTAMSTPGPEDARLAGSVIPKNRILSYYGFPGNELMGILGAYNKDTVLQKLQDQATAYEAVDSTRPIKLAFEVIASVAQADAGDDGNYLVYTDDNVIKDYVDYTRKNDLLLILDVQYGRKSTKDELDAMEKWLKHDHVHVALDPEFAVKEGQVPGQDLGTIDASDVTYAQKRLADFAGVQNISPKILIVHQFNYYSISNKDHIKPVDGVDFVLEVDGWGPPDDKLATYGVIAGPPLIEYYGFKLWYDQDEPLMTPEQVLALNPSPNVIIYQ
jgi:hypothetical protein